MAVHRRQCSWRRYARLMAGKELAERYRKINDAAGALHAQAAQIFEMTRELESLPKDTPAWYAGTRAKVEARRRVRLNQDSKQT